MSHARQSYDGQIAAFTQYVSFTEGHRVTVSGNLSLKVIQLGMFEKYDGVIVADRLDEQSLSIVRR